MKILSLTRGIMNWIEYVPKPGLTLLTGALTGLIVAFFTARYALKRFYQEKWWEKKLTAFLEVTEYTYKIKRAEDYWLANEESKRFEDETFEALSPEDEKNLRAEYLVGLKELTRISHLASFTLSGTSAELLSTYISEHNQIYPSWWQDEIDSLEASQRSSTLIDDLLVNLLDEAKHELKINN